jgi:acyl-CoA thioesterase-1
LNWLLYHIVSGQSFFTGVTLIVAAAVVSSRTGAVARRVAILAFLVGGVAVAVSSAAIAYWWYAIAIAVSIAWAVAVCLASRCNASGLRVPPDPDARSQGIGGRTFGRWRRWSPWAVVAVWGVAVVLELPYHVIPRMTPAPARSVAILGDSITAGMGDSDCAERWPAILARTHDLAVQDLSRAGATTATALPRAKREVIDAPVVILEIGGNDLLGSTSSAQFAADLDALLAEVSSPERQVVLIELPLPPFFHEYGRVQRTLARKHHALLVPKRVLLSVLAADGATVDSIHLTQSGHERMAAGLWQALAPAFPGE